MAVNFSLLCSTGFRERCVNFFFYTRLYLNPLPLKGTVQMDLVQDHASYHNCSDNYYEIWGTVMPG